MCETYPPEYRAFLTDLTIQTFGMRDQSANRRSLVDSLFGDNDSDRASVVEDESGGADVGKKDDKLNNDDPGEHSERRRGLETVREEEECHGGSGDRGDEKRSCEHDCQEPNEENRSTEPTLSDKPEVVHPDTSVRFDTLQTTTFTASSWQSIIPEEVNPDEPPESRKRPHESSRDEDEYQDRKRRTTDVKRVDTPSKLWEEQISIVDAKIEAEVI